MHTFDARTRDSAGAFLIGELERLDPTLHAPLVEVTWQRDIDLREDVGIEDETSSFTRSHPAAAGFAGAGKSWIGDNSTAIQGVGLDITRHPLPLHLWGVELAWSTIELAKAQRLGRPIDTQKYDGMKLKYQMDADEMVYVGDPAVGAVGLLNNPAIPPYPMQVDWATATADEILADINLAIEHAWARAGYVVTPDQLRLPPDRFALLVRPVSTAGTISILDYVSRQCVSAIKNGRPLDIQPLKWLTGAGVGGKDRALLYSRDKKYIRWPLVPMQKTAVELRGLNHLTVYYCKMGHVEFVYPETVSYGDMT